MLDAEELAELREEFTQILVDGLDTCVVSETVATGGSPAGSASDGAGGLIRTKPGVTGGTTSSQRTYPCRVTVPTSHNQKQENTQPDTSNTLTMALIVLPWDAIVYHTSRITVTFNSTKPANGPARTAVFEVTQIEPHTEAYSLHVQAVKLGV